MRLLIYSTLAIVLAATAFIAISGRSIGDNLWAWTASQLQPFATGTPRVERSPATSGGPASHSGDPAAPYFVKQAMFPETETPFATGDAFIRACRDREPRSLMPDVAPAAEFVDEQGNVFRGRAAFVEAASDVFSQSPEAQLDTKIESIQFVSPTVAIEDGTSTLKAASAIPIRSHYTVIHVKTDGKWWVTSMRETSAMVGE